MNIVVFGLAVSSSWGNGHATLWRGLIHALAQRGHRVSFFERDTPYYAAHRDCFGLPSGELHLYPSWGAVRGVARERLRSADVAFVTSYCPDAVEATELVLQSSVRLKVFYDLDTPVTLERLSRGESVPYLGPRKLADFDLVLSYTGGAALSELIRLAGARRVEPLYGSVDPRLHAPSPPIARYRADLSYMGTYAEERQAGVAALFLAPARERSELRFVLAGSQYPADFPWAPNVYYHPHVPPAEHAGLYCAARLNLNVTRAPMASIGFCPSGRLFEAAACGAALITDVWEGLSAFYEPKREILTATCCDDVLNALSLSDAELSTMAQCARERTLSEHTHEHRAHQLIEALERALRSAPIEHMSAASCGT